MSPEYIFVLGHAYTYEHAQHSVHLQLTTLHKYDTVYLALQTGFLYLGHPDPLLCEHTGDSNL